MVQSIAITFQMFMHDYPTSTPIRLPIQQLKQLRNLELVNSGKQYWQVNAMLHSGASTNMTYGSNPAGSSSSAQAAVNPLACVSCLTSLKHCITCQPFLQHSYSCITALTALQLLDLKQPAYEGPATTLELICALPQLTTLTKLHLDWQKQHHAGPGDQNSMLLQISKALKAAVGQLTKLQELRLCQQQETNGNPFWQPDDRHDRAQLNLPSSLTHLELQLPHSFSKTYTPSLSGINALQHLQLKHISELDPSSVMTHMTRLTHLELCIRWIESCDLARLLDVLPAMQQLQHLQLEFGGEGLDEERFGPAVDRQQCGAFMSSSHLTSLQLKGIWLPDACGSRLFPWGHKLHGTGWKAHSLGHSPASQAIGGSADIYSLIECCPNLLELNLAGAVQHGKSLSCLSHLQHLTALTVGGPTMDNICAAGVAEVTGLVKLTVIDPAPYNYKAADTAARRQQGGDWPEPWGGMEESSAAIEDLAGSFDCRGLRSLMQLRRLSTFVISRNTFLFRSTRYSSDDGYWGEDVEAFDSPGYGRSAWDNSELRGLFQRSPDWRDMMARECEQDLAECKTYARSLGHRLYEADHHMITQQRQMAD